MATGTRLGTRIRRARELKRLSQDQLGDALGISRSAVNAWENGRARPRNISVLEEVLGTDLTSDEPEDEVYTDPVERAIWEEPRLPRSEKIFLIEQLRARRREHVPRAHEPPA